MLHPHITAVDSSSIHGSGLIAREPIRAGEVVSRLSPGQPVYSIEDVLKMSQHEQDRIFHIAYQNSDTTLVAEQGPERFMNHSCDPNTWWIDDDTMVARRDIAAGEEITYDYATTEIAVPYAMTCRCGSAICRGTIAHTDYLIPEWQARFGTHLPSHTLRAIRESMRAAG